MDINLDKYDDHWVACYVKNDEVTHFDNFGVKYIPEEI